MRKKIREICKRIQFDISDLELINIPEREEASVKAVELVREGKAEILMKGMVSTGILLKALLDKEHGLRKGGTLSHCAVF